MGLALCASSISPTLVEHGAARVTSRPAVSTVYRLPTRLRALPGVRVGSSAVQFSVPRSLDKALPGHLLVQGRIRIALTRDVVRGNGGTVEILTNGRADEMIDVSREPFGTSYIGSWSAFDLLSGRTEGIFLGRELTLPFENYVQVSGIRSSTNTLALGIVQSRRAPIRFAELLPGSRIEYTSLDAPRFAFQAKLSSARIRVGDVETLKYQISSAGWPDRGVGISVSTSSAGVTPLGPPSGYWNRLYQSRGRLRFLALDAGKYTLWVVVHDALDRSAVYRARFQVVRR